MSEGWMEEKPYSCKKYHYIVDGFSLCGKYGFYYGTLNKHDGIKLPDDCAACFKKAEKRLGK
jgi:hypothetical protein